MQRRGNRANTKGCWGWWGSKVREGRRQRGRSCSHSPTSPRDFTNWNLWLSEISHSRRTWTKCILPASQTLSFVLDDPSFSAYVHSWSRTNAQKCLHELFSVVRRRSFHAGWPQSFGLCNNCAKEILLGELSIHRNVLARNLTRLSVRRGSNNGMKFFCFPFFPLSYVIEEEGDKSRRSFFRGKQFRSFMSVKMN